MLKGILIALLSIVIIIVLLFIICACMVAHACENEMEKDVCSQKHN